MSENSELLHALDQIEKDKNIPKSEILNVIENALVSAYKKHVGKNVNVEAKVNLETGEMSANVVKAVVEKIENPLMEIDLSEAKKINEDIEVGGEIRIPLETQDFSRIAAQTAKQVIVQKIRKSEKDALYEEMKGKVGQIVNGVIFRIANRNIIVDLGKTEAILPISEQVFKEKFTIGQHIRTVITGVDKGIKGPLTILSRTTPELVKKLFELEVPEIYEKVVEIVNIVREPGMRTKIAVISHNPKVDPVGACVGIKGARVKPIIDEIRGERIDLIPYSTDIDKYITSAFSLAKVSQVNILSQEKKQAEVIVPDDMLSLAIGKGGHNVRLAAKLTGWHIDVRSEKQIQEENKEKADTQQQEAVADLEKLEGITAKSIDTLAKAGFTDIEKLKTLSIEDLMTLPGIGEKTAEKIIKAAQNSGL
ncbi:MAG: transcription termination factor NusA [Elusimicrobiota bacterium]|jgi:N utilization substance protein A|nr:transcription termination factor NusA [Elusimicrobiota bacterium]